MAISRSASVVDFQADVYFFIIHFFYILFIYTLNEFLKILQIGSIALEKKKILYISLALIDNGSYERDETLVFK